MSKKTKTERISNKSFQEYNIGDTYDMTQVFNKWREWFETGHNPKTEFRVRIEINYDIKY
jgi:hypothetical protein